MTGDGAGPRGRRGAAGALVPAVAAVTAVAVVATVAAVAVVLLGLTRGSAAVPALTAVSGAVAVLSGLAVLAVCATRPRGQWFRLLLGGAVAVWGLGQLLLAASAAGGAATFPAPGDLVSALAAPLAVAGLVALPRRSDEPLARSRLLCESLVVGSVGAALVWRLFLVGPADAAGGVVLAGTAVVVLADLCVAAMFFVGAVRELDRGLALACGGCVAFAAADVLALVEPLRPDGGGSWPAALLLCCAASMLAGGMLLVDATPQAGTPRRRPTADYRRTVVSSAVAAVLMVAFLATLLPDARLEPVSVSLVVVCVAGLFGRQVVTAAQSRHLQHHLADMAYDDPLTGLGNRRALTEALSVPGSPGRCLATVDLDGFKEVNALLGHAAGDALLVQAAQHLAATCPPGARAYRLGGDEFAVLLPGDLDDAGAVAERLLAAVRSAALGVEGVGQVALAASVGLAELHPDGDPLLPLVESGAALQQAKAAGRHRVVAYRGAVARVVERRRLVERRLREAVDAGAVQLHGQPVVDLTTGRVSGVEMLARWDDDRLGTVSPEEFIAIAEATSLVVPLGDHLLDLAAAAAARLRLPERDLRFAVNASPLQLRVPGFADRVLDTLARHSLPATACIVEVTESVFVADGDPALLALRDLAAAGVGVAVDDFGAGSASLGYLRRLPGQVLKLDRSLVSGLLTDRRAAAIVTAMARMGRETGLDVVAEGVEDEATAQACRAAGIGYGQGWLWSRAVSLDRLDRTLVALGAPPLPAPRGHAPASGVPAGDGRVVSPAAP